MKIKFITIVISVLLVSCSSSSTSEDMVSDIDGTPMEGEMGSNTTLMGEFVDAAHPTMGQVTVNEERTSLFITDFKSDDGPLLEMYLATDLEATNYITLGELKGLEGNFNYTIPNGETLDFTEYKYLMVWCVDFSVNFGHAILE
ncbi:DM13 domain-containing protein [Muricauda sp. CAU 1633]|uniref:DM13 domain-containing protein n=1 Tax=Allomuricauda sp. CAU 1633 TaxID=2816036 RepID=UPI001A8F489A|nr:DM13 domain-containing protein [Muricauda sp. CAU 1633]MBO0323239.1 DM13 domain-containing protein [Muricauda sp. CAU 1633]